jgi:hypothetical protein
MPWLLLVVLLFAPVGLAAAEEEIEPPIVGQPPHFNGAVGTFRISATVQPAEVQAEGPVTYTVRITATGRAHRPPQRPRLEDFTSFKEGFYLENVGAADGDRPDPHTWEFRYRLRPKSTKVEAIPGFPFVSYKPGMLPPQRGYQTAYVPEVPLKVTPREQVGGGTTASPPIQAPAEVLDLATGAGVLARSDDRLPGPVVLAALVLLPPLACLVWYVVWCRLYPDAARQARRRRSRAAREALAALGRVAAHDDADRARQAAAVVTRYLQHRLDLAIKEPTPAEAAAHLRKTGLDEALTQQTAEFFRACDTARYAPQPGPRDDLAGAAAQLILALEADTWPPSHS